MLVTDTVSREDMMSLHDDSFPLPDLSNRLYISRKTVVESGHIAAIGLVRLTAEGILLTNKDLPLVTRARCSAILVEKLKQDIKLQGLDECHVFVRKPNVQRFLEHLGFLPCKGGDPLVIHF